jgi:pimeloyl-ACP methyl ester carboxylesterase
MATHKSGTAQYARNGDADIAYDDLGGAGGRPMLLIMGMAVSRFWWPQGLVQQLIASGFHVIAFDQRDAGESTRFPDDRKGGPVGALFGRRPAAYAPRT